MSMAAKFTFKVRKHSNRMTRCDLFSSAIYINEKQRLKLFPLKMQERSSLKLLMPAWYWSSNIKNNTSIPCGIMNSLNYIWTIFNFFFNIALENCDGELIVWRIIDRHLAFMSAGLPIYIPIWSLITSTYNIVTSTISIFLTSKLHG